uniref:Uncharacterized protein n=1 Tax=Rhizophora mucronata TaxID=61149 RepID=A0A2P2J4P4_RHIMU
MYLQLPGCMISYNTRTRVFQEACSYTYPGIYSNCCLFFPYDYGSQFLPEIASASLEQEAAELPVKERLNTVSF